MKKASHQAARAFSHGSLAAAMMKTLKSRAHRVVVVAALSHRASRAKRKQPQRMRMIRKAIISSRAFLVAAHASNPLRNKLLFKPQAFRVKRLLSQHRPKQRRPQRAQPRRPHRLLLNSKSRMCRSLSRGRLNLPGLLLPLPARKRFGCKARPDVSRRCKAKSPTCPCRQHGRARSRAAPKWRPMLRMQPNPLSSLWKASPLPCRCRRNGQHSWPGWRPPILRLSARLARGPSRHRQARWAMRVSKTLRLPCYAARWAQKQTQPKHQRSIALG